MRFTITKLVACVVLFSIIASWGWVKLIMIAARQDAERKQHERELLAREVAKAIRDLQRPTEAERCRVN